MKITALKPMMSTEDLRGTIDFYTNILGFACGALNEDWGWGYTLQFGQEINA